LKGSSEEDIKRSFDEGQGKYQEFLGNAEKRNRAIVEAKNEVDQIISNKTMLQWFRGKEILKQFHAKFVGNLGLNYQAFAYQVAERIGRKAPPRGILRIKKHIDGFVPWALPSVLEELLRDLGSNKETLSVSENLIVALTEAKSEAEKAVDEAKTGAEFKINRKALKEKCWVNLVTLRQHLANQPTSSLVEKLIMNTEVGIARVAAIMAAYSL
jgi:hypothetical protein